MGDDTEIFPSFRSASFQTPGDKWIVFIGKIGYGYFSKYGDFAGINIHLFQ
jgi:hypothetical protein